MTDIFRKTYRPLSDEESQLINEIKDKAESLGTAMGFHSEPGSREKSLARTKLEEAVMWAVKNVTG